MQIFINSVESLNSPVYSAPPCSSAILATLKKFLTDTDTDISKSSKHISRKHVFTFYIFMHLKVIG